MKSKIKAYNYNCEKCGRLLVNEKLHTINVEGKIKHVCWKCVKELYPNRKG